MPLSFCAALLATAALGPRARAAMPACPAFGAERRLPVAVPVGLETAGALFLAAGRGPDSALSYLRGADRSAATASWRADLSPRPREPGRRRARPSADLIVHETLREGIVVESKPRQIEGINGHGVFNFSETVVVSYRRRTPSHDSFPSGVMTLSIALRLPQDMSETIENHLLSQTWERAALAYYRSGNDDLIRYAGMLAQEPKENVEGYAEGAHFGLRLDDGSRYSVLTFIMTSEPERIDFESFIRVMFSLGVGAELNREPTRQPPPSLRRRPMLEMRPGVFVLGGGA